MPVESCSVGDKAGFRYGGSGKCYTHDGSDAGKKAAKQKAVRQALAIGGGKAPKDLSETDLAEAKMKTCKKCESARPISRFPEDKRTSDGRSGTCVSCRFAGSDTRSFAAELETVDLDGVELLAAGGPYFGQGSPEGGDHFDVDYLKLLASNANALKDEVQPPIKIGHSKSQRLLKNSGLFVDEMPAAGYIENQRVAGGKLLGDLKKVPKKLADLINIGAFRKRSVELSKLKSQTKDGEEYEVVSALALLGAKAPAVRTLNDIVTQWYSEDDFDHMEETVRLLLADVENDTDARTVDFADGDVVWDGENGANDWNQDLATALNANVASSGTGESTPQPYYVQDIDQINRRAIVCDWRSNTNWVVPFSVGTDGDPLPAPYEQWTLAEQAWVEASGNAGVGNRSIGGGGDEGQQLSENVGDTSDVSTTTDETNVAELSDEQVEKVAETFGIEESDAAKRREAVLARFGELAPTPVKSETNGGEGGSDGGEGSGGEGSGSEDAAATALSSAERTRMLAATEGAEKFLSEQKAARIDANIKACIGMGKIDPKDADEWRKFSEENYDLATTALSKLPVNRELFLSFGSDETGEGASNKAEELYKQYANLTGVPVREVKT